MGAKLIYKMILWFSVVVLAGCAMNPTPNPQQTTVTTPKEETPEPSETRVSFVGVGDNLIHETIYLDAKNNAKQAGKEGYDFLPMYTKMKPLIESADLAFLNQETILGGDERGLSGYPVFNSPSVLADQMIDLGFDIFNHATNHSMDKGKSGIQHAAALWRSKPNVIMSGIFDSEEDRQTPRIIERKGIRFAFLAYTYGTNGIKIPDSYLVSLFDKDKIKADVDRVRELADVIIVSAHWGTEGLFTANSMQKEYAKYLSSLGVDVVIGTHPHTIQPIEWLRNDTGKETLVIYSLGNFISGMLDIYNLLGGMIGMEFVRQPNDTEVTIENVTWTPLVTHYDGNPNNIMSERYHYEVMPLSAYTEEQAKRHALNGYNKQTVTIEQYRQKTKDVIQNSVEIIWD